MVGGWFRVDHEVGFVDAVAGAGAGAEDVREGFVDCFFGSSCSLCSAMCVGVLHDKGWWFAAHDGWSAKYVFGSVGEG